MAKKSKGLTEEEKTAREEMVDALEYAIECVKDGVTRQAPPPPPSRRGGSGAAGSGAGSSGATVDVSKLTSGQGTNMEHSEQSRAFRAEFEEAKRRQDEGLDEISKGLSVLKNLGEEMDEEVKRQAPIMDAIDDKLDSSAEELHGERETQEGHHRHALHQTLLHRRHPHLSSPRQIDSTSSTPSASDGVTYENLGRRKHHASRVHHNRKNRSPRARVPLLVHSRDSTERRVESRKLVSPGSRRVLSVEPLRGGGLRWGHHFSLMAFTYGPATSIPLTTYGSAMVLALAT